ncbi:hypothetical protein ACJ41O_001370 [Fusarium nematophilum]
MADERTYTTIHASDDGHADYDIAPLTTVWTIPEDCPSPIEFRGAGNTLGDSCYPPDYESVWYNGGAYSPGLCFSGYTSGCEPTDTYYGGPLKDTETAIMCVPSGYSCSEFLLHASSMSGGNTISVPMFQIRWAESDLAALETHPLSPGNDSPATATGATVTVTGSRATVTAAETSSSSSGSSGSSGLPTGAVVGIAVGSAAVIGIIAAIIFCLFRRRYKKKQAPVPVPPTQEQPAVGMPELAAPVQPVGFVTDPKPQPQFGVNGPIPGAEQRVYELDQREKSPPPAAYGPDGVAYSPTNSYGGATAYSPTNPHGGVAYSPTSGGMPAELAYDGRLSGYGAPEPGVRYEMGVYERPVAEMDAIPRDAYPRHG